MRYEIKLFVYLHVQAMRKTATRWTGDCSLRWFILFRMMCFVSQVLRLFLLRRLESTSFQHWRMLEPIRVYNIGQGCVFAAICASVFLCVCVSAKYLKNPKRILSEWLLDRIQIISWLSNHFPGFCISDRSVGKVTFCGSPYRSNLNVEFISKTYRDTVGIVLERSGFWRYSLWRQDHYMYIATAAEAADCMFCSLISRISNDVAVQFHTSTQCNGIAKGEVMGVTSKDAKSGTW